jgi:hypothetical protein
VITGCIKGRVIRAADVRQVDTTAGPTIRFKGGRIVVGGGTSVGSTSSIPSPAENVLVLDALAVQGLGGSCEY